MEKLAIEDTILTYVQNRLLPDKTQISASTSLLTNGRLDSIAHLRLVGFLEKQFGIEVKMEEFDPDNFDSVEQMAKFVTKKLKKN